MEKLALVLLIIASLMVTVSKYPDAVEGAQTLYIDIFGEENDQL
jgi:hypothetical protein